MAWRLGADVTAGMLSIRNRDKIEGWFDLSDGRRLELELRGEVEGELLGKQIQFRVPAASSRYFEPCQLDDLRPLSLAQVGVARHIAYEIRGVISRINSASLLRNSLALSDAIERKPCLCLEWFSDNGRVVVEIIEPTIFEINGQRPRVALQPNPLLIPVGTPLEPEDCAGLASQLPDWPAHRRAIDPQTQRLYAEWDEAFSDDGDVPVASQLSDLAAWPDPADVSNAAEAEKLVDDMLDRLAMLNIQFDFCEHYSSVAAYRLLLEEFIPYSVVNPNLAKTKVVAYYDSLDHCPQCRSELCVTSGEDEEDDVSDEDCDEEDCDEAHVPRDMDADDEELDAFSR